MDALFEIRNSYHLGNYQSCINVANRFRSTDKSQQTECAFFMYLSYFEQRAYGVILGEIDDAKPTPLLLIKKLVEYTKGDRAQKDTIISNLESSINSLENYELCCFIVSALYAQDKNIEKALKVLHPDESIASSAAKVQLYLNMNRLDLARKQLKQMQDKDEYATLTQLSLAWVNLSIGGTKLQEVYYIVQELIDKNGATPLLLNIQVASLMSRLLFDEASELCQKSLEMDGNNPETLINLIALSLNLGRPSEFSNRYFNQLRELYPQHEYILDYSQREAHIDQLLAAQE